MPGLTLILSDLYLPPESGQPPQVVAPMPNLDWLLRFAAHAERVGDWRSWLARRYAVAGLMGQAPAQAAAEPVFARLGLERDLAVRAWFATPVHLEPRIDHVRLADRGIIALSPEERARLVSDFARHFSPDYSLFDAGPRGFFLVTPRSMRAGSVDPARLLDMDVGDAIVTGEDSGDLRRVAAEIEMWLHRAAVNAEREASGRRSVSTLWLWGGEAPGQAASAVSGNTMGEGPKVCATSVLGEDPWLTAFAARRGQQCGSPPGEFAALDGRMPAIVELNPMSGDPRGALARLEELWFGPIRAALSAGELQAFELLANDRIHRVPARPAWRFWRQSRPWLERLWSRGSEAKA